MGVVGRTRRLLLLFLSGGRTFCCRPPGTSRLRQERFQPMNPRLEQSLALLDPVGSTVPHFLPERNHPLSRFIAPPAFLGPLVLRQGAVKMGTVVFKAGDLLTEGCFDVAISDVSKVRFFAEKNVKASVRFS